jgi:hypothetical protein
MSNPESKPALTRDEQILRAMRLVLTNVVRDTATAPGLKHPLRPETIEDIRQCLMLISARERELAEAAGRPATNRPRFVDEPTTRNEVTVPVSSVVRRRNDS